MGNVRILIEDRSGRKPSPHQLSQEVPLCWNTADGILYGLKLNPSGIRQVVSLGFIGSGAGAGGSAGITNIYVEDHPQFPIEFLKFTRNGQSNLVTDISKPNGIVAGGQVTWMENLQFIAGAVYYYLSGDPFSLTGGTVTLEAADAELPRIDIICVDATPGYVVIKGVPSENPQKPVPAQDQIELTQVLIPAGATTPGGGTITTELIYDENLEWTVSAQGVVVDPNYTEFTPVHGLKTINVGMIGNGDTITFTRSAPITIAQFDNYSHNIRLKTFGSRCSMTIQLLLGGVAVSKELLLSFDIGLLAWQNVGALISAMGVTSTMIDGIRLKWLKSGPNTDHSGFYLDFIKLEAGIDPPPSATTLSFIGDVTGSGPTTMPIALQLKKVLTSPGVYGSGTQVPKITVNAKGLVIGIELVDIVGGKDGATPYIGENLHWWIAGEDTGVVAVGQDGQGVPLGGTAGQILKKKSATDYDTEWVDNIDGLYFDYRDIENKAMTYVVVLKAVFAFEIQSIWLVCDAATSINGVALKINGVAVTGLSAISVTTTPGETLATGNKQVAVGDTISLTATGITGTPTELVGTIKIKKL